MSSKRALVFILVCACLVCACDYIVLPEDLDEPGGAGSGAWSAVATNVSTTEAGDLHMDITIRNDTGDWSAMQAAPDRPAVLSIDGQDYPCDTVFVDTGGHRLAPGFQMRGYVGGTKAEPAVQLLYVECQGAAAGPGATLSIDYSFVTGEYNYYMPDATLANGVLEIELDAVAGPLEYPVAEAVDGLVLARDVEITAINDVRLVLAGAQRTAGGLTLTWHTANPGEYPSYVHVGNPPVIGRDGILYGYYETPDIVSVPISPAGGEAEWTTEVGVPQEAGGLYILLSVESKKQRLFVNYALDISDL